MTYTQTLAEVPEPEKTVLERMEKTFHIERGRGLLLKECVKQGNPAGYYCDFVYHGFDPRLLDARQEPKDSWRELEAIWTLPDLVDEVFGLRIVFHKGDPVFSEGYSFRAPLPEHASNLIIRDICELKR